MPYLRNKLSANLIPRITTWNKLCENSNKIYLLAWKKTKFLKSLPRNRKLKYLLLNYQLNIHLTRLTLSNQSDRLMKTCKRWISHLRKKECSINIKLSWASMITHLFQTKWRQMSSNKLQVPLLIRNLQKLSNLLAAQRYSISWILSKPRLRAL